MTLHDFYFKTVNEKPHLADCKWKIVDKHTRKNLCGDFATCDYLTCASCEEKSVWSSAVNTTKNGVVYVRVTVYDPIKFPTKPKEEPAAEETAPVQPAEQAQESAKAPRYQVIVNDDRYGGLDEKLDYSRITDARKAMHDYVNKEDWESAAIYDRKSGEIIETYGEYFPVDQINVRAKAQEAENIVESVVESAEAPEVVYVVDNRGNQ